MIFGQSVASYEVSVQADNVGWRDFIECFHHHLSELSKSQYKLQAIYHSFLSSLYSHFFFLHLWKQIADFYFIKGKISIFWQTPNNMPQNCFPLTS